MPSSTVPLSAVRSKPIHLSALTGPHEGVIKLLKDLAGAVPCAAQFQMRCAVGHVDQIAHLELLGVHAKHTQCLHKLIYDGLQPSADNATFLGLCIRADACLDRFFDSVSDDLIVHLRGRRLSSFSTCNGGAPYFSFKRRFWARSPRLDGVRQTPILGLTE